jgi:hypothetical protein
MSFEGVADVLDARGLPTRSRCFTPVLLCDAKIGGCVRPTPHYESAVDILCLYVIGICAAFHFLDGTLILVGVKKQPRELIA